MDSKIFFSYTKSLFVQEAEKKCQFMNFWDDSWWNSRPDCYFIFKNWKNKVVSDSMSMPNYTGIVENAALCIVKKRALKCKTILPVANRTTMRQTSPSLNYGYDYCHVPCYVSKLCNTDTSCFFPTQRALKGLHILRFWVPLSLFQHTAWRVPRWRRYSYTTL